MSGTVRRLPRCVVVLDGVQCVVLVVVNPPLPRKFSPPFLTDPHSCLFLILIFRFICIIPVEALVLIRKKEGRQRVAFFVFLFQIFLENYQFIALDYFLKKSSQLGKGG